ncbi:MAG TPA: WecB/TagA/CpsF family glycosyltransferase [Patescibacteria group bacterium]|nr:WecB/TagA/CpsF family glycosyltransferase [Patescibacteria group bacterium]
MGLNKTKVLGINVTTNSRVEILEEIKKRLAESGKRKGKPLVIVTPNPEQIVLAQKDKHLADILNRADVAIPDGIGLALVMRLKRIPGVELMEDVVAIAAKEGYRVGLIGGWHGVALKALECLQKKYPRLNRGWTAVPEDVHLKEYLKDTRIVFVGLGAPKQEYFIDSLSFRPPSRNPGRKTWIPDQVRDDNKNIVLMAVGGSFDILAGRIPRAPMVLRTIGLEWLWRLIVEPWRWRRQMALVKFFWLVMTA